MPVKRRVTIQFHHHSLLLTRQLSGRYVYQPMQFPFEAKLNCSRCVATTINTVHMYLFPLVLFDSSSANHSDSFGRFIRIANAEMSRYCLLESGSWNNFPLAACTFSALALLFWNGEWLYCLLANCENMYLEHDFLFQRQREFPISVVGFYLSSFVVVSVIRVTLSNDTPLHMNSSF